MSIRYCFKYDVYGDEHFTGSFKSTDGEEYAVKMDKSFSFMDRFGKMHRRTNANLTIRWKKNSNKFITVSTVPEENDVAIQNTTKFIIDRVETTITMWDSDSRPNDSILIFIIDIVPCPFIYKQPVAKPADEKLTPKEEQPIVEKKLEKLSTDIRHFLTTGELSDVVLTDGSKEIRAHKLILSARSSVFAKMFQHPMKENRENKITVEDVSHEVLLELLNFMYSGTVVMKHSSMARDLYVAADKYDVRDLKDICSTMLKSVNLNSVLDTLLLADLHSDQTLKEAALDFISKNCSQLKATQNWSGFMKEHPSLAVEILNFVIDEKS